MRGFRMGDAWSRLLRSARLVQPTKPLCTNTNNKAKTTASTRDNDAYRQLEKLDFMTAAKILFTTPPQKKKFGIDFHLVQLFFVCMPSLAVYLVAQYARYEIRRMEAEVELKKKKAEEEEKAKEEKARELEASLSEEREDPELSKVKVRLEALEEAVKEIVVESKKLSSGNFTKDQEGTKREQHETVRSNSDDSKSEDSSSAADNQQSKKRSPESKPGMSQESVSGSCPPTNALVTGPEKGRWRG